MAVDGAYALFNGDGPSSDAEYEAIRGACERNGMACHVHGDVSWRGGEVEKRAYMFRAALEIAEPQRDWFLIMDADEVVERVDVDGLLAALRGTDHDVALVSLRSRVPPYGVKPYRVMFRAIPGLTVERTHYIYTAPDEHGKRYMWGVPRELRAIVQPELAVDVTKFLTINHCAGTRARDREKRRQVYYQERDRLGIERK